MRLQYDEEEDELIVVLKTNLHGESFDYEMDGYYATIDEGDELIQLVIPKARDFVRRALAAGVKVEGAPEVAPPPRGMVWHDADSSMISAFGYDEAEEILEVAFHSTGVYRYFEVPKEVFEGLRDASSQGSYMRDMIIDMYPWEQSRGRRR
jgi:hypothetical protein